jgi:hypothetical protein
MARSTPHGIEIGKFAATAMGSGDFECIDS